MGAKLRSVSTAKAALYFAGQAISDFHPSADGRRAAGDGIARNVAETQDACPSRPLPFLFAGSKQVDAGQPLTHFLGSDAAEAAIRGSGMDPARS